MIFRDTETGYGLFSRLLHWVMALGFAGLFALGWWMVGLDYYSPYYHAAPDWHRSLGLIMLALLVVRVVWRFVNPKPSDADLKPWEQRAARAVHGAFYPLLLVLMISGYLISTSDGRGIDMFGLFTVPSLVVEKGLSDTAGTVHEWIAYLILGLALVHAAAALKHHFMDRSDVLRRMWRGPG